MRVSCMICVDIIVQNQEVLATPCGHTFHAHCIIEWIKVSKSCPQCRTKATNKTLIKLFFETTDSEIETDPDNLQQQIDNLKFQLKLKEQEAKKHKDEADMSKSQAVALREEFRAKESILTDKETQIRALKTQVMYTDNIVANSKKMKEEIKKLKQTLSLMQNMSTVLEGTTEEVTMMVNSEAGGPSGARNIATFCTILKQELTLAVAEGRRRSKEAQKEVRNMKETMDSLRTSHSHLEEEYREVTTENKKLKAKIRALEQSITSPSDDVRSSAIHRLLFESPAPALLKRQHTSQEEECVTPEVVSKRVKQVTKKQEEEDSRLVIDLSSPQTASREQRLTKEDKEEGAGLLIDLSSPQKVKKRQPGLSVRPMSLTDCNIMKDSRGTYKSLHARPSTSQNWKDVQLVGDQVGYDGLGGHHKADEFPKPSPLMKPLLKRTKTLYRPLKGKDKMNKLTKYFENTFED
ncbi:E3 ubiquitin-protein ligase TRAIP-like [Portunus trituberculatus]|uniref:E3 ubiquitin-protein ligase TRAIP-like n=1 Tax=Portunus trituberculatus TaxID=210409 RepID=UPI001E1CE5E4|nr:E3 ubiquitin-protein ligase TRAIP-like [Portunus trituberculatus]